MDFEFNDCDVCVNPEIIFSFMNKGALAWDYIELRVAERNGTWDYGYSSSGGGRPCSPDKRWEILTRQEAIDKGVEQLKNNLQRAIDEPYGVISKNVKFHFDKLVEWENKQVQLTLF